MDIIKYLTYMVDIYDITSMPTLLLSDVDRQYRLIDMNELSDQEATIISYNYTNLATYFRVNNVHLPKSIIDVTHVGRLLSGQPHSVFGANPPWSIWNLIKPFYHDEGAYEQLVNIHFNKETRPGRKQLKKILMVFGDSLYKLWTYQKNELIRNNEFTRYYEVEKPINEILINRQLRGVNIDEDILCKRLDDIDKTLYTTNKYLRNTFGITDVYDKDALITILEKNNYPELSNYVKSDIYDSVFEIASEVNEIIGAYQLVLKCKRDKNTLLRFGAFGEGRIYPVFEAIGTVTGRITVKAPSIQQLKVNSRDIIVPDEGMSLIYPDYCQFEPGIMAFDSGDTDLIERYNSGDIYSDLGKELFRKDGYRKFAKKLFLSYSYGMKKERILSLLKELSEGKMTYYQDAFYRFFEKFNNVEVWKNKLTHDLLENGYIETVCGNKRYRLNNTNELSNDEKRWVISQRVQGTASYILKQTILKINENITDAEFLIPMHDAVLYQVPTGSYNKIKRKMEGIFIETYKTICPSIIPRVSFNVFSSDK